ncbi:YceI family protein [Rehaibacterium terrae]|jgi:polyisoprenoid-binding protein YceI|uniref:Polyisoprenoid-binding protein YceI n=1 Tax=Rehaibacterium terrae TaxID=1341696 RepID=A0A7W7Y0P6_9GAMM|nr:YceI family protein [Rehaibacterium terrae]MBB5015938.1 polyisoprenoid-binding protein YceI [Rehaibacterium terrae]
MIRTLALALLLACSAHAADWRMDPAASTLGFIGMTQGERFEGRFGEFQAAIRFDPDDLDHARFDVTIALASADTANAERDEALLGSDFFHVRRHPQAHYRAERFRALGDGRYAADGELSLRGITRPVTLEFRWTAGEPAILEGEATLRRLDFDIGGGDWADLDMIANEVQVRTRLALHRAE